MRGYSERNVRQLTLTPSEKSVGPKSPEASNIRSWRFEALWTKKMSSWEDFLARTRPFSTSIVCSLPTLLSSCLPQPTSISSYSWFPLHSAQFIQFSLLLRTACYYLPQPALIWLKSASTTPFSPLQPISLPPSPLPSPLPHLPSPPCSNYFAIL